MYMHIYIYIYTYTCTINIDIVITGHADDACGNALLREVLGEHRRVRVGDGAADEHQAVKLELGAGGLSL